MTSDISDDNFVIDKNDSRKIDYMGNIYSISDSTVSDEELGEYQDVLAEVRVFNSVSGKSIPRSEWGELIRMVQIPNRVGRNGIMAKSILLEENLLLKHLPLR